MRNSSVLQIRSKFKQIVKFLLVLSILIHLVTTSLCRNMKCSFKEVSGHFLVKMVLTASSLMNDLCVSWHWNLVRLTTDAEQWPPGLSNIIGAMCLSSCLTRQVPVAIDVGFFFTGSVTLCVAGCRLNDECMTRYLWEVYRHFKFTYKVFFCFQLILGSF